VYQPGDPLSIENEIEAIRMRDGCRTYACLRELISDVGCSIVLHGDRAAAPGRSRPDILVVIAGCAGK
jgi:hypothetical protein